MPIPQPTVCQHAHVSTWRVAAWILGRCRISHGTSACTQSQQEGPLGALESKHHMQMTRPTPRQLLLCCELQNAGGVTPTRRKGGQADHVLYGPDLRHLTVAVVWFLLVAELPRTGSVHAEHQQGTACGYVILGTFCCCGCQVGLQLMKYLKTPVPCCQVDRGSLSGQSTTNRGPWR
jgi:hypothetical protein